MFRSFRYSLFIKTYISKKYLLFNLICPKLIRFHLNIEWNVKAWHQYKVIYIFKYKKTCNYYINNLLFFVNVTYRIVHIIGFVLTFATRRVQHMEQDLLIFPEHTRLSGFFCGARVAQSLVFYAVFCILFVCLLVFPFLPWCCQFIPDL